MVGPALKTRLFARLGLRFLSRPIRLCRSECTLNCHARMNRRFSLRWAETPDSQWTLIHDPDYLGFRSLAQLDRVQTVAWDRNRIRRNRTPACLEASRYVMRPYNHLRDRRRKYCGGNNSLITDHRLEKSCLARMKIRANPRVDCSPQNRVLPQF